MYHGMQCIVYIIKQCKPPLYSYTQTVKQLFSIDYREKHRSLYYVRIYMKTDKTFKIQKYINNLVFKSTLFLLAGKRGFFAIKLVT